MGMYENIFVEFEEEAADLDNSCHHHRNHY